MWSIFTNEFQLNSENKEWLQTLFENIEYVREQELIVPFKIVTIKTGGFQVRIQGLYGYIPFKLMPWNYRNADCWVSVFSMLKEKTFYGKVIQVDRSPVLRRVSRIIVDATMMQFKDVYLYSDEDYKGIVFHKAKNSVFVDIGFHFNWKSDEIRKYRKCIVTVFVYMNEGKEPLFFVDNKYPAILECSATTMKELKRHLFDGAMIHCKINEVRKAGCFSIKWIKKGIINAISFPIIYNFDYTIYKQVMEKRIEILTEEGL